MRILKEIDMKNSVADTEKQVGGKYLSFALAEEEYGLPILQVKEIIGMMAVTAVPQMPDYIKGVINLRGKVIPVIDIRLKFGMEAIDYTEETCIIVLNFTDMEMGIVVDRVCEVHDIDADRIEAAPDFGAKINTDFIMGMGKINDRVAMLLDIEKILIIDIETVSKANSQSDLKY